MSERTVTVKTQDPTPAERRRQAEERRKQLLPRMFWDPQYYADPRNANVARSIVPYGPGSEELTVSQFNRAQIAAQGSMISPRMVGTMIEVLSASPTVSPGVATALAQFADRAGFDDALLAEILTLDAQARATDADTTGGRNPEQGSEAEKGGMLSRITKGISRPLFALASIPVDVVQGAIRNAVARWSDPETRNDFVNPFNTDQPDPLEQSTGAQFLAGVFTSESADLGSGWFPAGDVQARAELARREAAPLVFNEYWTLGRGIGSMFFDNPDDLRYQNVSGLIDLVAALALDPTVYTGVGAARTVAQRTAQQTAAARAAGEAAAAAQTTREAITLSEQTTQLLQQERRLNAATFAAANDVARSSNHAYAQAQRMAAQSFGAGPSDDIAARIDQIEEQIAATRAEMGTTRAQRRAEPRKAREERAAAQAEIEEVATRMDSDMAVALDDLTMQLGDDGLDALQAKVLADSPELPGPFTDAVFVPGKRTDPNPTALPGAVDGTDAILMWTSEKSPALRSVDDPIEDVDSIVNAVRSSGSRSNQRRQAVRQLTELVTRPGATYGDLLDFAATRSLGVPVQAALRASNIDGITDVFRLTGGEGGVWWTSKNVAAGRWSDEVSLGTPPSGRVSADTYRVYDETMAGQKERLAALRERKKELQAEQAALNRRINGERAMIESLTDSYVAATDLRTSIADSGAAIRNSIEYSMGVRRELGGVPRVSDDLLKQWLLGPTRDFDAAIAARGYAVERTGVEGLNRAFTALTTMGASEAIRGVGRLIQPFATRSREAVFDAMVRWDLTPQNLGRLQRLTSGRIDPTILKGILAAKTEDEVLAVIGPAVGVGITRPITPGVINALPTRMNSLNSGRSNNRIFNRAVDWMVDHYERLSSVVPRFGAAVNLADAQGGANVLRNYLANIRAVDTETADQIVGQFLDATTEVGRGRALVTGMKTVQAKLVEHNAAIRGISDADKQLLADRLGSVTGVHEGARAKVQNWWLKRYAGDSTMGFMTMNGEVIPFVGPQLEAELVRGGVVLPDSQEIARAIGRWGLTLTKHPGLRRTLEVLDTGMDLWRSVVLVRFAYTLRNVGEMQFRMFMSGHSSVYNNPMGALAMASAMNKRNRTSRGLFARFAKHNQTATGKVLHEIGAEELDVADDLVPEYVELMQRSASRHDMRSVRAAEQFHDLIPVGVGQPGFARGWSEKLLDLRASRIARLVAGYNPPAIEPLLANGVARENAIVDWLLHSDDARWIRADYQETQSPLAQIWSDPVALRNFLFTGKGSIRERIQEYTIGGKEELVNFIVNGTLVRDGEEIFTMSTGGLIPEAKAKAQADRAVRLEQAIRPYLDELPSDTELAMRVNVPKNGFATVASEFNRAIDWFFNWNGRKENAWAVGPEFAYAYNDAAVDMMPMLNLADRQRIYDWVKKAETRWTPHSEILMRARSYMKSPEGSLDMSDVERVAAARANEHVKGLFYDAQQRRQLFHQLRLAMPFAQPFFDTLWRWGRLMAARPYFIEKFGRLGEALTDPGSGVIYDDFDWIDPFTDRETRDPTQGFIYTHPQSGEAYFTFPLIGSALGAALSPAAGFNVAESMTLNAPVQNLNLAFQGDVDYLPGVGPLISMPLSVLMPDDAFGAVPEWIRDYVFPYGEPKPEGGILESTFLPSWARRMTGALYNESFRAYSYKGMMAYLVSTQEYPGLQSSPVQQQRLIEDTQHGARILTFIRALGAAILPAAPTQEIYAADSDGRLIGSSYLATHWQHLINESGGDYEAATKAFIDSYGMQALSAIVGSSTGDAPISGPGWEFFKSNPESQAFGDVIGYFFPGDMSLDAYQFQQNAGDRRGLSVEERTDRLIQFLYNAEKTALEGRAAKEFWDVNQMDQAEEELKERYGGVIPQFAGTDSRTRLDQIRRAIEQFPALANTRGGEGAQLLFESYDEYTQLSQERYGTGLAGQKAEGMRDEFLREVDAIVAQYGGQNVQNGSVTSIARLFVNVVTPKGQ